MNSRDKSNLDFLMSSSAETLAEFYDTCSLNDLAYALELVKMAISESYIELAEVLEQDDIDCSQANKLLSKFRLTV